MKTNNTFITRVVAILVVVVIGGGALIYSLTKKTSPPETASSAPASTASTTAAATSSDATAHATATTAVAASTSGTSTYKNGTYSATGSYLSPGGNESIGVTVTLTNDVVTSARVTPEPVSAEGKQYQAIFEQNFTPYVVGKNISDIKLTHVSGSSLTPTGFNDALSKIEAEAKA